MISPEPTPAGASPAGSSTTGSSLPGASSAEIPTLSAAARSLPSLRGANDVVLIAIAVAGVLVSIGSAVVGWLGIVPAPLLVVVVLAASGIALRGALLLRSRRSTALSNPKVFGIIGLVGLALSGLAAIVTLGAVLRAGGDLGGILADVLAQSWTLALLMAAAAPVRSVGWRALVGAALAGFLAAPALARTIGTPIVDALGADNALASSVWVPITEEVLKALPVLVIVLMATSRRRTRPSVIDVTLLGAFAGAAYTVIENAEFGRSYADVTTAVPFSFLFPMLERGDGGGLFATIAGHTIWTALVALGLGFGLLYRRRFRFAWIAIPATLFVAILEHGLSNAFVPLPLGGLLSVLVLMLAFAFFTVWERHQLHGASSFRQGFRLSPPTLTARQSAYAASQLRQPARKVAGVQPTAPLGAVQQSTPPAVVAAQQPTPPTLVTTADDGTITIARPHTPPTHIHPDGSTTTPTQPPQ